MHDYSINYDLDICFNCGEQKRSIQWPF